MPTKPTPPTTLLGRTIRDRRGSAAQRDVEGDAGVPHTTLSRIERGTHAPSLDTAVALAKWLGWSVEQVVEAARTPVEGA